MKSYGSDLSFALAHFLEISDVERGKHRCLIQQNVGALTKLLQKSNAMNNYFATVACLFYVSTLYPGISRILFRQYSISFCAKHRRSLGIASCVIALHHVFLCLAPQNSLEYFGVFHYASGIVCLGIFLILTVTSFPNIQKKLGRTWKKIHSLTYFLPIILAWHILEKMDIYSPFTRVNLFFVFSALSLLCLRFLYSRTSNFGFWLK